ncbi:MAG: PAS domain S-box protein [Bacteroidota bacterium]|nr:PAS domain S-box protein [Bacteroidota bacterium]
MVYNYLKILVVEDNLGDFILLLEMLAIMGVDKQNIVNTQDLNSTVDVLEKNNFDLVFLDLSLPDSEGLETFYITESVCNSSPIIVLSGSRDTEVALETVKMGAQDYLIKGDFDGKILVKSVAYCIERKKNLDNIRDSKKNYEALFEKNPLPMWVYDVETLKFLYVNKAAVEHYGYSKEEFLNMDIMDVRPKEEWGKLKEDVASRNPSNKHTAERTHLKKNGDKIFVEINSSAITIDGRKSRLVLAHDITERKIVQSNVFFQANILQNITEIVVVTNLKGTIVYWNQGATECYGYDKEEVIGRSVNFIMDPEESFTFSMIISHLQENKIYEKKSKLYSKFNQELWIDSKISFIYDVDDKITGLLFISRNVSEKVKNDNRLLLQKHALDAVGLGIIITDPHQKDNPIIYANPKFKEITGYTDEDIIGKNCSFLQGEKSNKEILFRIRYAFKKPTHFQGEMLTYKKNGEYFWCNLIIDPVYDEREKLINFIGFIQDISLQKKSEDELIYKNKELNTFIYRASHDLRSPIASLMGLTEVAQLEFGELPKVIDYLKLINQTSTRLDGILKNLLNLTAIKQGDPIYQELCLDEIIQEVVDGFSETPDFNTAAINLDFEKPAILVSDRAILHSILKNLIENALRYKKTRNHDHSVRISFSKFHNKYRIVLADNGIGIKKEGINKVFDMFYRGTEVSKGSGLGLYMVKNFVDKLKGNVEIFSEYQVGTTFVVDLPEVKAEK